MEVSRANTVNLNNSGYDNKAVKAEESESNVFLEILGGQISSKESSIAPAEEPSRVLSEDEKKKSEESDVIELLKMGGMPIEQNLVSMLQEIPNIDENILINFANGQEQISQEQVSQLTQAAQAVQTATAVTESQGVLMQEAVQNLQTEDWQSGKTIVAQANSFYEMTSEVSKESSKMQGSSLPVIEIEAPQAAVKESTQQKVELPLEYTQKQGSALQSLQEMSKESKKETTINVEELQKYADEQSVSAFREIGLKSFSSEYTVKVSGEKQEVVTHPILEQVQEGISRGVSEKLETFTIRLRPEGLGEILVHMESAGEKIAMSIGVSKLETQKILDHEMMQLKELLKPFNAEIKEVYQSQPDAFQMMDQQQKQFQQQREQFYAGNLKNRLRHEEDLQEQTAEIDTIEGLYGQGNSNVQGWNAYV